VELGEDAMNRRNLLRRAITVGSAAVFTATSWLMGARTLTMEGDGTWTHWVYADDCGGQFSQCNCDALGNPGSTIRSFCDPGKNCPPSSPCFQWDNEEVYCCNYADTMCQFRTRSFACGSCPSWAC
jgi:hypothetical protein